MRLFTAAVPGRRHVRARTALAAVAVAAVLAVAGCGLAVARTARKPGMTASVVAGLGVL
jgi:hypothetical protein